MIKRRVVVTGLGTVNPLGNDTKQSWNNLIAGKSGLSNITHFDASSCASRIAGEVKTGQGEGMLNISDYISSKESKKKDRFIQLALIAAQQAVEDSGWKPESEKEKYRTGVIIGSGIGGLPVISNTVANNVTNGKKISPFFIPSVLINLASGHVSMKFGFRGPNHSVVTACATGTHAIGDASRIIKYGDADVMVCGGSEASICEFGINGFSAMKALSTSFNDNPTKSSRPWDRDRDGFVMSEGSAILVLEEYEHAKKRGAKIYAEILGYGMSGDAYHMAAPEPEGTGSSYSMKMAMKDAKLNLEDVDYINAHGTSTPAGDLIELKAISKVFGNEAKNISISSTKSATGHLLGSAGSLEALFSILAIKNNIAPPTINLDNPSEGCEGFDLTPHKAKERKIRNIISNSFGFGGTNSCLAIGQVN
jgi:3-oxoacyl-[acyl-carrier-protein] synthase II